MFLLLALMDPSSISVEITIALTFLQDLAAFSKQLFQEDSRELVEKIADLNLHLNFAAPFGQLQDVPLGLARAMSRYPPPGDKQATTAQKVFGSLFSLLNKSFVHVVAVMEALPCPWKEPDQPDRNTLLYSRRLA